MGYRQLKPPAHHHRRDMDNKATPGRIFLEAGTVAKFSIPCWYRMVGWPIQVHGHNRDFHDWLGWPSPDSPDHSCQEWDYDHSCCRHGHAHCEPKRCHDYIDMCKLWPIHLRKEGYSVFSCVSDVPIPDHIRLRYSQLNWSKPTENDLQNAFDQMGEDEFAIYRKWYLSKKMSVRANTSIRKKQDWIIDLEISADAADTDMPPFDMCDKLVTVGVERDNDDKSGEKIETVGKYIVSVQDPTAITRPV
nr:MAG TPA: hypothetical protein [Caudoviricetes sp.]